MAGLLKRIFFHKRGEPRDWLKSILFDRKGRLRSQTRRVIYKKSGHPRPQFRVWLPPLEKHVRGFLNTRWEPLRPLTTYPESAKVRRITLVTDSIGPSSLFGGVGTALILAALWSRRAGADLRIVTRTERPVSTAFSTLLGASGISFGGRVEFLHAPHFGGAELSVGPEDMFLATSWWTARCLLNTVPASRIVYLLQEDERMFYPFGDDHLACSATLAECFRFVVVNSGLLHRHLTATADEIPGLAARSIFFEPAFLGKKPERAKRSGKLNLFFYARPNNPRNLFSTGVNLINEAVLQGVLDPTQWTVHLVGSGVESLVFDGGLEVMYHEPMELTEYLAFLQSMDAGVSLMYTPHPSYPPLDLASVGIPVLTSSFGPKTDLSSYSKNILCEAPTIPALLEGLRKLVDLAKDSGMRLENLEQDHINRDWVAALESVVERLANCWKD